MQMICWHPPHPKIKGEGHFEPSCQYSPPRALFPLRGEINNEIWSFFAVILCLWDPQGRASPNAAGINQQEQLSTPLEAPSWLALPKNLFVLPVSASLPLWSMVQGHPCQHYPPQLSGKRLGKQGSMGSGPSSFGRFCSPPQACAVDHSETDASNI